MERVGALISKLQEQYQQKASAEQLKVVAQMLLAELQLQKTNGSENGLSKVSIVMPAIVGVNEVIPQPEITAKAITEATPKKVSPVQEEQALPVMNEPEINQPVYNHNKWQLNPLVDVPTLAHQNKEGLEINQTLNGSSQSFNERLRVEKIELGASLKSAPVRDLKKAIGVNDRFHFIKELFRGDETMYERSIKTINSFHIYAEAQYWIQRELKLKIGWSDDNPAVAHFDELVKRRFS